MRYTTRMFKPICLICLLAVFLAGMVIGISVNAYAVPSNPSGGSENICDPASQAWIYPIDAEANASDDRWARFAWDGFVALNWPKKIGGAPGEPDENTTICDSPDATPSWLSWMQKEQLLLPDGASPGSWADPTFGTPMYDPKDGGPVLPLLGALSKVSNPNLVDEFNEAFSHRPLLDQNGRFVLFEIYLNQSEFEYISQNRYYDAAKQYAAFATEPPSFRPFPDSGSPDEFDPPVELPDYARQGAIELKASWKQLTAEEVASGRFFTRDVYYASNISATDPPCGPISIGLVGLHVLQLTPSTKSTWFWATFEQVDNVEVVESNPTGLPSFNPGPNAEVCMPPYQDGYTCEADACIPAETGKECPPPEVAANLPPDVCNPDLSRVVNVSRVPEMAISPMVNGVNEEYQSQLPAPWKYYELVNTMQPDPMGTCCVPPDSTNTVNTCYMTNTTMETYTQYYSFIDLPKCGDLAPAMSMNCTDCHAVASPLGAPRGEEGFPEPSYQIFTFMLNNAKSSCPSDLNYDGRIDGADLALLLTMWSSKDGMYDIDEDGFVGGGDLGQLLGHWGKCS